MLKQVDPETSSPKNRDRHDDRYVLFILKTGKNKSTKVLLLINKIFFKKNLNKVKHIFRVTCLTVQKNKNNINSFCKEECNGKYISSAYSFWILFCILCYNFAHSMDYPKIIYPQP